MITEFRTVNLSEREKEILFHIAYEQTSQIIGQRLFISPQTVDTHRKNIMNKLSVRNTAGMIRKAFESGILGLDGDRNVVIQRRYLGIPQN